MRLFRVTIEVGDAEEASTFYRALFGQRPRPVGGSRAYLDCGPTILALLSTAEPPRGTPEYLYFEVDDLEAGEIVTRPWGERSFYAEDPWSNHLCFVQSGTLFIGE
jgi:catechol 2,3-dioxygenase-like lactoylglutathione lyase family enzyme